MQHQKPVDDTPADKSKLKKSSAVLVLLLVSFIAGTLVAGFFILSEYGVSSCTPPNSSWHIYSSAAVASDSGHCSEVGKQILHRQGSAVDAAIATLLCLNVLTMHSSGIGGGLFMVIWNNRTKTAYTLDGQMSTPLSVVSIPPDLFNTTSRSRTGPLLVGIPGAVAAMWAAHQEFGRIAWPKLFKPAIELCRDGFKVGKALDEGIRVFSKLAKNSSEYEDLRNLLTNKAAGRFFQKDDTMYCPALAATFERLARHGGPDFYNGAVAKLMLEDFVDVNIPIIAHDLSTYNSRPDKRVVVSSLPDEVKFVTTRRPSGGPSVALALKILSGYNIHKEDSQNPLTYQRFIETLKYAFHKFTWPDHERYTTQDYLTHIREEINNKTLGVVNAGFGARSVFREEGSTTHVSVIDAEGNAVSVTSTINFYFGSMVMGKRTGIIFNNAISNLIAHSKLTGTSTIQPNERVLSTMAPAIVIDSHLRPKYVIGASGGYRIVSSISYVLMRALWFGEDIHTAIDKGRLHYHFASKELFHESSVSEWLLKWFQQKGYKHQRLTSIDWRGRSVIQAIQRLSNSTLIAVSDFRKPGGYPDGF